MPPEPLPWDRKDFFRERKNERSSSENLGGGGGLSRWRDTPSHHHRWGSAEFRRPPGYGKQGGWHMFPEDSFHGSGPTRSNDKILDDERGRPFGKYGKSSSRENRGGPGPISQRDWKGHCWDAAGAAPPNGSARMQADVNERRSVDDMLTYNSHNHSDFGNSWDQLQFKDQNDKNGGVNDSSTGQRFERENLLGSIDWKPLKWTRSGSLSSRGSGFSHSSGSKSMAVDSTETKVEGHPQNVSPLQSPSGNDAAACVTSAAPSEETSSRKKPRLGWGEGLAKYEKKKVDVPDETAEKNGAVICESNIEPVHCHISNVLDRSPRIQGFLECASPATPSSVACSSSPGVEDKTYVKTVNVDTANLCGSPCPESQNLSDGLAFNLQNLEVTTVANLSSSLSPESQNQCDGLAFNLQNLEVTTVANLSSSLSELLQSDNPCSVDSGFVRSTAMKKLLVLKADISKKLEVTESEIDSLENELKSLISETGTACPRPASSSSLPVVCIWKPSEEPCAASSLIPRPAPLQLHSSGDMIMKTTLSALEGELAETKDEDIDSPGTATSKFAEPLSLGKPVSEEDILKHDECLGNVDTNGTKDIEVKSTVYTDNEESTGVTSSKHIASSSCCILSTDVGLRRENILCDLIMASNKDSALRASEVFNKALPANLSCVDISRFDSSPSWKNNPLVKEKFVMRKRFLMFKERVITLKFRAFQHLWKEDLRLLSMRRCRAKSQKKFELSSRMSHSGCQKHRSSSIRSRFSSPAGNLSLVPTTEVINFASKLLADSHVKMYRSALKMPALILDKKEMLISRFTSTNGLVEDPCAAEKERCMINPWTSIEKEVFLDKLATFGKDFRKIASFLDHKTTADCVEFYYKNHKSDCFQKTKKKPEFAKQGKSYSTNTYLVTSSKRWNRDNSAGSLDILGAASSMAANVDDGLKDQQKCATRFFFGTSCDSKTTRGNAGMLERSSSLDILVNDRETVAADVLAGICGSLSSEAMSSCITSSIDLGEGYQERKGQIVGSSARRPLTPEVTQNVDDETCSDESYGEMDPSDWTDEEKSIFIQAVASYGKDFTMISQCVRTRSRDQCKVFFSKARKCLGLDVMRPGPCNEGTAASDNANGGGGSDTTEDVCFVENGSVICNDKQGSKKEEDLPSSNLKVRRDEIYPVGAIHVHPELDQLEEDNRTGELDVKDTELRSENIVSDECAEDKVDLDLEGYSNIENCVGRESLSLNVIENGFAISDTKSGQNQDIEHCTLEESVIGQEDNDNGKSSVSVAEVEIKSEGEVYTNNSRAEKTGHELLLGRSSLNDKRVGIADVNLNDFSGINCSVQGTRTVSLPAGNASVSVDTDSLGIGVLPAYEHRNAVKLDHVQNPHHVDSGKECNGYVPTSFMLQDPAAVQHEKNLNHDVELKIHSEKIRNKQFQNSAITDDCHQHVCGHALLDHVDPSKILRGYPVSMTTKNGTNGDIGCNKPASLHTISEVDRNFHSGCFLPKDLHLEKCNGSKHHDAGVEHSLSQDQLKDYPRKPKPQFSSDSDKPTHNGDVKLFGQILSHPPTQQKPNSRVQEKEDRGSQHAKLSDNSFNLKFTGTQNVDGIFASAKFDRNSYLGLENLPVRRSFGFWDGNRIQTGFPSLPDSAMLLAKYPAAFSNYPMSSSKVEQQYLHSSIVRSNDCNLNGATVFPTREISSSKGVADFQAYRSRDCTKLQPYTLDLKQRQDMFLSEMQIRGNEFDAVSSIQQQARGMVGINVVGRGGILLGGGPCTGVSDPVAAIKMHYAKTEQYGGQAGSIIREEESWRSNGDIGRK